MTTLTCAWSGCGRSFEAERADARYCSPSCRAKASRERRRVEADDPGSDADEPQAGPQEAREARPERKPSDGPPPVDHEDEQGWARFIALEERVDDLEFYGKQDQAKLKPLFDLPARVENVERTLPAEAKVKEWSKEAMAKALDDLGERIADLEALVEDGGGASPSQWAAAEEGSEDGGIRSLWIRLRHLELAVGKEIERGRKTRSYIVKLAKMIGAVTDVIG